MPLYRGVEAADIAESIQAAQEFVRYLGDIENAVDAQVKSLAVSKAKALIVSPMRLVAGALKRSWRHPEEDFCLGEVYEPFSTVTAHISQITAEDFSKICTAKTTEELVCALEKPKKILICLDKLFRAHGCLDTNGQGQKTYQDLHQWEALSGITHLVAYPVDFAVGWHLRKYPVSNNELYKFSQTVPSSYIQRFGIDIGQLVGKDQKEMWRVGGIILEKLKPFLKADEFNSVGIAWFGPNCKLFGAVFDTSLEGAEMVSKALSEYDILNERGQCVFAHKITVGPKPQLPECRAG